MNVNISEENRKAVVKTIFGFLILLDVVAVFNFALNLDSNETEEIGRNMSTTIYANNR